MIESLTEEQIALFPHYREKWLNIGLSTGDCDVERCKEIIPRVYEVAGLKPPTHYFLADSPVDCIKKQKEVFPDIPEKEFLDHQIYGCQDASWLSYFNYFLEVFDLECCKKLQPLMELAEVCGWWAPYEDHVFLQHKPSVINMVDGVLHCEDGPSVLYRDGFSVWSIGGVRVDEQIVMSPETQTIEQINGEENQEVKRIRIERFGWENFLEKVNAQVIHERQNDIDNTIEALMAYDDMRVIVCSCISTGRIYCLEVPNTVQTCEEAQQWMSPDGYCIGAS